MPDDVFGGRVDDQVGPERQRGVEERRPPGAVDRNRDALPMRRLLVDAGRALVSDTLEAGTEEITLDLDRAA